MQPGPAGEQVTDFAYDQDNGLLFVIPEPSAVDIITIQYFTPTINLVPHITATMKVSDLAVIPPQAAWRMYFAANAPETGIVNVSGSKYSKGLSDDGDQFFVQASTDAIGLPSYKYGTTVRNFDGSTSDTIVGDADFGSFDQINRTIKVRVSTTKLNAILTAAGHPTIVTGSTLCGLRGRTFEVSSLALEDFTRGGTEFKVK